MTQPLRVLIVCSHPVQYASPIFRLLAKESRISLEVAYCSLQGAETQLDPDFGVNVKWDIPLLDGYGWTLVPNHSPIPNLGSFFGLFNAGIWRLIHSDRFDAVVLLTGYVCSTFWIAMAAAKWSRLPVLFGTDAFDLAPRDGKKWKLWFKRIFWPPLFRLADMVIVVSSGGVKLMRSLGIGDDCLAFTPFCVDNDWWVEQSERVDRRAVRARWNVPEDAAVILFCAKLQPWKRPLDLLEALPSILDVNAFVVFAGDGALSHALEDRARELGIASRVRLLGFVNQSLLPETYTASDVLVLPSESEPFGLVVNEAMLCRCPAIVSDRVGARFDLINEGETGHVFPCGDVDALAAILSRVLADRIGLRKMGERARRRMDNWSPKDYVSGLVGSISKAVNRKIQMRAKKATE